MWFLDSPPKKVQRCKFSWRLAFQNSSYNNFIRYRKSKMMDFWKKVLKLPKFQKPISQELFRVGWKDFAHFCFLLVGTFEPNLLKIWEDGWQNWIESPMSKIVWILPCFHIHVYLKSNVFHSVIWNK